MNNPMWTPININSDRPKQAVISDIESAIARMGYTVVDADTQRPWGGFFRFDEHHGQDFKNLFFTEVKLPQWAEGLPMSPKILFTAPQKRLSWQYHHHRGEVWKIVQGDAHIFISTTNQQPEQAIALKQGSIYEIPVTHRHRLCAQDTWVVWAEMWIHTDPHHPSQEADNVRVADDFGR